MEKDTSIVEEKRMQGIYGEPDLNREECSYYLGELRERVMSLLTIPRVGKPLCNGCWNQLAERVPEEWIHYRRMRWVSTVMGTRCPVCAGKKKIM